MTDGCKIEQGELKPKPNSYSWRWNQFESSPTDGNSCTVLTTTFVTALHITPPEPLNKLIIYCLFIDFVVHFIQVEIHLGQVHWLPYADIWEKRLRFQLADTREKSHFCSVKWFTELHIWSLFTFRNATCAVCLWLELQRPKHYCVAEALEFRFQP